MVIKKKNEKYFGIISFSFNYMIIRYYNLFIRNIRNIIIAIIVIKEFVI